MPEDPLRRLGAYPAVVFDLDGTLVRLRVDWPRVQREMAAHAASALGRDFGEATVWAMLRATEGPDRGTLERVLNRHEEAGARRAEPLPAADLLPRLGDRRRGVVTLNGRRACHLALERTGLAPHVDAVVAREDVTRLKPDPESLLRCLTHLRVEPGEAVFVGDRDRDQTTAQRAGTAFRSVHDLFGRDR